MEIICRKEILTTHKMLRDPSLRLPHPLSPCPLLRVYQKSKVIIFIEPPTTKAVGLYFVTNL
jgi:hypothetical protein